MSFEDAISNSGVQNVTFSAIFQDVVDVFDTVYAANPEGVTYNDDGSASAVITKDCLSDEGKYALGKLEEVLGIEVDNLGVAYYDKYGDLTSFYHPKVAKVNGQVCLAIGAENVNLGCKMVTVPLGMTEVKINSEEDEEEEKEYRYHFLTPDGRKVRAKLITTINEDKSYQFLGIKNNNGGQKFNFHLRMKIEGQSKEDVTSKVEDAYETGRLLYMFDKLKSVGISISKTFYSLFTNGNFPDEGVLMVLSNPVFGETPGRDGKPGYPKSSWKVEFVSDPSLVVNGFKPGVTHALGDVDYLTTHKSFGAFPIYRKKPELIFDNGTGFYWLHVIGANKENAGHIPLHAFRLKLETVPPFTQKLFKNFINLVLPAIEDVTDQKQLSSSKPKSLPYSQMSDSQVQEAAKDGLQSLGFAKEEKDDTTIEVKAELVGATNGHNPSSDNDEIVF